LPYIFMPYTGGSAFPRVASGTVLTIEPGVVIKPRYGGYPALWIEGKLVAQGTTSTPIIFTSLKDDDYGGDTNVDNSNTTPAFGDWKSIKFRGESSSGELNNILFRYGNPSLEGIHPGINLGDNIIYES